jgi:hypothetical protein
MKPRRRKEITEPTQRRRVGRRRSSAQDSPPSRDLLYVASSNSYVTVIDGLNKSDTRQLLGEDVCWQFARLDWRMRKPRFWHRSAFQAWRTEGAELDAKRARLIEQASTVRNLVVP